MQAFILPQSPVGPLWGQVNAAGAVTHLQWGTPPQGATIISHPVTQQLTEYFAGTRTSFTVPLAPQGTAFQQRVWQGLLTIPHGHTCTYAQLASTVGTHPRPLGGANGRNPIPILIPCHRVVGAHGSLGGYSGAGGLSTKATLLRHEGLPIAHA